MEKEDFEEELKELQDKVSTMKKQMPDPSQTQTLNQVQWTYTLSSAWLKNAQLNDLVYIRKGEAILT